MTWQFSESSKRRFRGVHADLRVVAELALEYSSLDFGVTEGVRSIARQRDLIETKASRTLRSRHLTGHAIDIVVYHRGKASWHFGHYLEVSKAFKRAARELGISIEWGGDWRTLKDGPHYQLSWRVYPSG